MGFATVFKDDVRNAARSYVVVGVIGVFAALVSLVFIAEIDVYDAPFRAIFDASFLLFMIFPLVIAPLTYLAIAGDRSRGTIKFVLGLPNSRLEYFFAKYVSRATIAVAAVAIATGSAFLIAALFYVESPDFVRFLKFLGLSALFAMAMAGTFVTVSAMTRTRSRAMIGVFGAYFVLGPFWLGFIPVIGLDTVVDAITSALGVELAESTRQLIGVLSPSTAYLESTELIYTGVFERYRAISSIRSETDYLADRTWFAVLVMAAWATVVPLLGFLRFRSVEVG
ncbi:hypothetical protein BRD00_07595 [Halobacteriales archaeon QS_8_69_26]|nr:MAG: hypothetical protein BRD00_07595 [Halobacteriales archaeon QS_8_69_26]